MVDEDENVIPEVVKVVWDKPVDTNRKTTTTTLGGDE
jgi:hypothetical protein